MKQHLSQSQQAHQKQNQLIMLQPKMQQALNLLQAPILELATLIEIEMEQNPILEYREIEGEEKDSHDSEEKELTIDDNDFSSLDEIDETYQEHFDQSENYSLERNIHAEKKRAFAEGSLQYTDSLFTHLMNQAKETFESKEDFVVAEEIIGSINEHGYFTSTVEEIALTTKKELDDVKDILLQVQTFEPYGVGGSTIQEALLIQLKCYSETDSLAYKIIERNYDDLIHNRIPKIEKELKVSSKTIEKVISKKIAPLDIHPGIEFSLSPTNTIVPDVKVSEDEEGCLQVEIDQESFPNIRINGKYLKMIVDKKLPKETAKYIKQKMISAKWLMKNLFQRNDTLLRMMEYIVKKQSHYLTEADGKLVPMTMKEIAQELELHDSTIARAVANKYVDTSRGILPIRHFFSVSYETDQGESLSSKSVQDTVQGLISQEDKQSPLSDQKLSDLLKEKGIHCARRTIAKYRHELNIGNAQQRRKY